MKVSEHPFDSKRKNVHTNRLRPFGPLLLIIMLSPIVVFAQQAGIPPAVNTYDHFKAGEIGWTVYENNYWTESPSNSKVPIETYRTLLVRIRSSDRTLSAFDKFVQLAKTMPVESARVKWSEEQKNTWDKSYQSFLSSFFRDVTLSPEADFFFRLGLETSYLVHSLPEQKVKGINSELIADMKSEASWFVWFKEHDIFPTLSEDVQRSIQTIAALKSKLDAKDPLEGGLSMNDIDKTMEAAELIETVALNRKLLR